jgi:hypothetical protein
MLGIHESAYPRLTPDLILEELVQYQQEHTEQVDHIIGQFMDILTVQDSEENNEMRLSKSGQVLAGKPPGLNYPMQ